MKLSDIYIAITKKTAKQRTLRINKEFVSGIRLAKSYERSSAKMLSIKMVQTVEHSNEKLTRDMKDGQGQRGPTLLDTQSRTKGHWLGNLSAFTNFSSRL